MKPKEGLVSLKGKEINCVWVEELQTQFFSAVDIVAALEVSLRPRRYWSDIKMGLKKFQPELYEKIVRFKLEAKDHKKRFTDFVSPEVLLAIKFSLPKAKIADFVTWVTIHQNLSLAGKHHRQAPKKLV